MKKGTKYACVAVLVPLLLFAADYLHRQDETNSGAGADTLLLLLPDAIDSSSPEVQEWLDAASEEGLHLRPIHDSEFLNPLTSIHAAGIILPDQLHRSANDVLIGELYRYVRGGGNLMVVYDACTFDLNGRFPPGDSRLSELVGVRYALYDLYTGSTMEPARVTGTAEAMQEIDIPPGSYVPLHANREQRVYTPAGAERDDTIRQFAFAAYEYGNIDYPVFRTLGDFDGTVLLRSRHALVRRLPAGGTWARAVRKSSSRIPGVAHRRPAPALVPSFLWHPNAGSPISAFGSGRNRRSGLQLAHRRALVVGATQDPGG